MSENKVKRFTFEDTLTAQKKLRKKLDKLVREERPLKESERDEFLDNVARALLGQGSAEFGGRITLDSDELVKFNGGESVENLLRALAYYNPGDVKDDSMAISKLWKIAREGALAAFPKAISMAVKVSPESHARGSTESRGFG